MFTLTTAVALVALGVAVGVFGTVVGAGGGFLLTPVLLVVYPTLSPDTVTGISLIAVFFNALSGSIAYARQRRIDFRSGGIFALATLPGAVGGALVVTLVSRKPFDAIMALVLVVLAGWLVTTSRGRARARPSGTAREITDREGHTYRYEVPIRRGALYSVGVGFVSSFLGIGGGVIHVPLLVGALGFPTHVATATSHFVLMWMAGVGSVTHAITGSFHHAVGLRRAAALSVGVVGGAQVGALLSRRLSGPLIQRLLAGGLVVLAGRLVIGLL